MWRCRLLGGGERLSKKVCVGSLGVGFIGLCLEWGLEEEESVDLLFGVSGCWCESWKTGNLYYPGLYVCAYALCKAKPVLRVWLCCNFQAKWLWRFNKLALMIFFFWTLQDTFTLPDEQWAVKFGCLFEHIKSILLSGAGDWSHFVNIY